MGVAAEPGQKVFGLGSSALLLGEALPAWKLIATLLVIGGLVYLAARVNLPLGRLPGDFRIERQNFSCTFPLATSILLSIIGIGVSLLFESFGYKHGIPLDADIVFDVRCLPNPHYDPDLRPQTGKDEAVMKFLEGEDEVIRMRDDIFALHEVMEPRFRLSFRIAVHLGVDRRERLEREARRLCEERHEAELEAMFLLHPLLHPLAERRDGAHVDLVERREMRGGVLRLQQVLGDALAARGHLLARFAR